MDMVNDLAEAKTALAPAEMPEAAPVMDIQDRIETIDITKIVVGSQNPRRMMDEAKIVELATSIKSDGLLQPILVRPQGELYEIVAGERRFRACKLAGLKAIQCKIRSMGDKKAFILAFKENDERVNLSPMEEAHAYHKMQETYAISLREIGEMSKKSHTHINNRLLLLKMIPAFETLLNRQAIDLKSAEKVATWGTNEQARYLDETCSRLNIDMKTLDFLTDARVKVFKSDVKSSVETFERGEPIFADFCQEVAEKHARRKSCEHIADAAETLQQKFNAYAKDEDIELLASEFANLKGVSKVIVDRLKIAETFIGKLLQKIQTPPKPAESSVAPTTEVQVDAAVSTPPEKQTATP